MKPQLTRRRRRPPGTRPIGLGYLILAGLFLVAVLVGVLINYWVAVKRPGDQPVLQVNNRFFSWSEYVSLLKSQKLGADYYGGQFNAGVAPYQLMQTLAENELIRQAAVREGLRVTDEMVRGEMISRLLKVDQTSGADPKQIDRELGVAVSNYLAITQLSFSQYKDIVYLDLLRNQLREKLGATIPRVQPHIYLHMIRVRDLSRVDEVQKRLKGGEAFSRVARQLSDDADVQRTGGEIGWTPRRVFPEFDQLLFGLDVGEVSQPIQTPHGLWIVKVVERVEDKARLQAILVEDGRVARDILDRIQKGADFSDLAGQVSIDPQLRAKRGDLGLLAAGDRGGVFDQVIQGIPANQVSEPQATTDGTVFLMVTDRTPALEVADNNLTVLKTRALEVWLRREWDANHVNYCPRRPDDCFSNTDVDKAINQATDVSRTNFERAATATAQARSRGSQAGLIP